MRDSPSLSPCSGAPPEAEEQDIIAALTRKRKELDDEIAQFTQRKEQEFKEFEATLRSRRKASNASHDYLQAKNSTPQVNASSISLAAESPLPNGYPTSGAESRPLKGKHTPSLDGLRVQDPAALSLPSPSPSPSNSSSTTGQQSEKSVSAEIATPPVYERDKDFQGLFTPAYLSLLDSKHASLPRRSSLDASYRSTDSSRTSPDTKHKPPPYSKRNSLNLHRDNSISPMIKPSSSLPSALRRTSSDHRPKSPKHVTFRLSDFTVVDPSSSYEELSTPEIPSTEEDIAAEMMAGDDGPSQSKSSAQRHSMPKPPSTSASKAIQPNLEDDDSVFAFDEDLDDGEITLVASHPQKPPDDEVPDLDLEENVRYSHQELKSGSPAAGSLPISIVRPSPRGLEGGLYGGSQGYGRRRM